MVVMETVSPEEKSADDWAEKRAKPELLETTESTTPPNKRVAVTFEAGVARAGFVPSVSLRVRTK